MHFINTKLKVVFVNIHGSDLFNIANKGKTFKERVKLSHAIIKINSR